ncbi:MAG: hypothetical protein Q9194_005556 [Teloschistes cf. exilis]
MATPGPRGTSLDHVDEATLAVIEQILSEDIEELVNRDKGKNREGEKSDAYLAVEVYRSELRQFRTILADRNMSRSLARAVIADSALMTDAVAREDSFANDRLLAERLSRGEDVPFNTGEAGSGDPRLDDLFIARLTGLYVSDKDAYCLPREVNGQPETAPESSRFAERSVTSVIVRHQCVSCGDQRRLFEIFQAPCDHYYCQECLSHLFELATTDETIFPPRCCRHIIPLMSARLYLDSELFRRFQEKAVEYQTSNRTYCSRPTCSAFIPPNNINGDRATCTTCSTNTCTVCKGNSHDGDCPFDTATQQLLEAAEEEGWQRCRNCRRIVELNVGCNHMTYVVPYLQD